MKNTIKGRKFAIVLDLDETVLSTVDFSIFLHKNHEMFTQERWRSWVYREEAMLVPGAKKFMDRVHRLANSQLVFISNRQEDLLKSTVNNMIKLGAYHDSDIFLLRKGEGDSKAIRRREVNDGTGRMRVVGPQDVVAYFGDRQHDFPKNTGHMKFGVNLFILPNPLYGQKN